MLNVVMLNENLKQFAIDAAASPKVALSVTGATTATAGGSWMGWLPDIDGVVTVGGLLISAIICIIHIKKYIQGMEEHRISMKILKLDLDEREERARNSLRRREEDP
jgi:hypothetical protein